MSISFCDLFTICLDAHQNSFGKDPCIASVYECVGISEWWHVLCSELESRKTRKVLYKHESILTFNLLRTIFSFQLVLFLEQRYIIFMAALDVHKRYTQLMKPTLSSCPHVETRLLQPCECSACVSVAPGEWWAQTLSQLPSSEPSVFTHSHFPSATPSHSHKHKQQTGEGDNS